MQFYFKSQIVNNRVSMKILRGFYERDTAKVAQDLLGKTLLHSSKKGFTSGKIVETEAYYGKKDPASRASEKKTKINKIMWKRAGLTLIYMVHGHWLFNVTTEGEGVPGAVLIRALEPIEGIDLMKERRDKKAIHELTSGPGKLTQALNITKELYGVDLTNSERIFIKETEQDNEDFDVKSSNRIGVTKDLEKELRFYIAGNKFVS